jgi:hypothetical protein
LESGAAAQLEAAIPDDVTTRAAWEVCAQLLPHARTTLDPLSMGMRRLGQYLGKATGPPPAPFRPTSQRPTAISSTPNTPTPNTPTRYPSAPTSPAGPGQPVTARDMYTQFLPIRERVLGPDHPNTLLSRSNLASAYQEGAAGHSVSRAIH